MAVSCPGGRACVAAGEVALLSVCLRACARACTYVRAKRNNVHHIACSYYCSSSVCCVDTDPLVSLSAFATDLNAY